MTTARETNVAMYDAKHFTSMYIQVKFHFYVHRSETFHFYVDFTSMYDIYTRDAKRSGSGRAAERSGAERSGSAY